MRKSAWLVVLLIVTLSVLLLRFCGALYAPDQKTSTKQTINTNDSNDKTLKSPVANIQEILGTYTSPQGVYRKYILVAKEITDQEIIMMARQLHLSEPETWYYFMDSKDQFESMLTALPKTAEGDYSTWPVEYVEEHYIGRIMQEMRSDGNGRASTVWKLEGGLSRKGLLVDL